MDIAGLLPPLADALARALRVSALVAAGVFLATVAVEFGAVQRVAGLSRHLTGPANLPDEVGAAILTTTASTTAGYGMLADFRESGRLDDRAALVAVTVNTVFGFCQHVFTFYAPVLLPILGLRVGLLYVGTRAAVALAITLVGVLAGAVLLSPPEHAPSTAGATDGGTDGPTGGGTTGDGNPVVATPHDATGGDGGDGDASVRARLRRAGATTLSRLRRIVPRLALVYALVSLLVATVDLRAVSQAAGPLAEVAGLPAAAVPVVVVFALDTTAGAATVAPLIGDVLAPREAVATLLLGAILSFAVTTFRRSIPFQYGVWGASFGAKVVAVNTAGKLLFLSVAAAIFLA